MPVLSRSPRSQFIAIVLLCGTVAASCLGLAQEVAESTKTAEGGDWPQFLGPQRNGVSHETGLIQSWPASGLKEVWRAPGGGGVSGLAISDGTLYTLVERGGKQTVVALTAADGGARWETPIARAYENQMGDGPRATPTVAGKQLYALSGEGILAALSAEDGSIAWSRNTVEEFGGKPAAYGMVSSPLVAGENVIVTVGARTATLAAFNSKTGNVGWTAGRDDPAGYSSPVLLTLAGRAQIVVFDGGAALGVDPATGDTLWHYPYKTDYECNIAVPLVVDGMLFLSAGENHGCVMLSLEPSGDGFEIEKVWESQGPRSVMRNEWQTSILRDGYLYGLDNVGSAGPVTHLTCVEAATGKQVWQQQRFGKGNLIAADGKLFVSTMDGEVVVVRATPDGYEELGRQQVLEPTRQAPSLANGLLYLRDDREIVCLDVRQN